MNGNQVDEKENAVSKQIDNDQLIIIGDEPSGKSTSLQDSFKQFRSQKIKERQLMKLCQEASTNGTGRSPEYKDALRSKFIETAKRYLGVPYGERYKEEGDPVAPLYLDCCGLIRKVVQDLQEDFGFIIGKWNQAYQMDTLPIALEAQEMKPGDLVFYEGTFTSKRSKQQKHNNVHVEIFLGGETGEATIGSRYHRGKVSIFPSYKFESKVWTLTKHHFRSIDTWLDGICKSFCVEHAWYSDALAIAAAAGKRSIFAEDDDESAGGEDSELEDEEQVVIESCKPATDGELKEQETVCLPQKSFEPEINETGTNGGKFTSEKAEIGSTKRPKRISKLRSSSTSGKEISKSLTSLESIKKSPRDLPRTYYVGKSNGWKLVKAAMDRRGWQQLPFEYQFSNRFGLKWVERRSQIDYRAHVPGQLVCHIPNNDCITTKIGLLYTLKDCFCKQSIGSAAKIHVPWLPETYDLESPADCDALIQAEKSLVRIKKEQSREQAAQTENTSSPSKSSKKSFPLTPSKLSEKQPQEVGGIWIYKPTSNNRGRGIRVLCGLDKLKEACYGSESSDNTNSTPIVKGIVQKYIEKPLLVNREGYKFDIRVYLLIARNYPTTLAFYHPGYCRLSLKPYSLDLNQLEDASVHLTNASIQKKDPIYATLKESQIQSVEGVAASIEADGKVSSAEYMRDRMDHDIMLCLVDIMKAANKKLLKKHGYFDLLGCDFMISEDNQLSLLEINTNPALSLDNNVLENLLPGVVDGALGIVLAAQGPDTSVTSSNANSSQAETQSSNIPDCTPVDSLVNLPGQYRLIFDEATGYCYSK